MSELDELLACARYVEDARDSIEATDRGLQLARTVKAFCREAARPLARIAPEAEPSAAFTPGPWMAAARPSSIVGWPVVARPHGKSICSVSWLPGLPAAAEAEVRANARLISAAPDLLKALIGVVAVADRQTDEFDAARAAVARATGQ